MDLGVSECRIPVGTHRERGEPEGREGDAGRGSNSDEKEKEERCGENKKRKGVERIEEGGGKEGGRGKVRGKRAGRRERKDKGWPWRGR